MVKAKSLRCRAFQVVSYTLYNSTIKARLAHEIYENKNIGLVMVDLISFFCYDP